MTIERKVELCDSLIGWVWEHTVRNDYYDYVAALHNIGLTKDEAVEDLSYCYWGFDNEEELKAKAIDEIYKEDNDGK